MSKIGSLYWLFVDAKTRVVSKRLSQVEAEAFLQGLRHMNIEQWWAWNPFMADWILLKNIIDVGPKNIRLLMQLPTTHGRSSHKKTSEKEKSEVTRIPEEYSEVRDYLREEPADEIRDFHGDDITFSRVPKPPQLGLGPDRRQGSRVARRLEVLVAGAGKSYRTTTINISSTGVMLEKELPVDLQGGPFELVFILLEKGQRRQVVLNGKISGDLRDRRRLVFTELPTGSLQLLEQLMAG